MSIKIGNLLPKAECTLKIQILKDLVMSGGCFMLQIPQSFYPNYGKKGEKEVGYEFLLKASVNCESRIAYLSLPDGSESDILNEGKQITFQTEKKSKVMSIYFRTEEMLSPQIHYAELDKHLGMKAVQLSFVPSFEPVDP